MRELKFRVWNGYKTKEFKAYDRCRVAMDGAYLKIEPYRYDNDYAIEQYTGLKDKNGKEIYEGDIVVNTYYDDGEMYKVLWVDDSVAFGMESLDDMELYKLPLESLEVIGNIHENPELLEEEE